MQAAWRKLRLLWTFLFDRRIRLVYMPDWEWVARNRDLPPNQRPGKQKYYYVMDGHYCAAYKKMQLCRTIVDGQVTTIQPHA